MSAAPEAGSSRRRVLLIGTRDTKEVETDFLRDCLEEAGMQVIHLDPSIRRTVPGAEIGPEALAQAAGTTMDDVRALRHEGRCQAEMLRGALACAAELRGKLGTDEGVHAILGIGGSMGTGLATAVMREFPYGLPKVMISTMASGFTAPYVGTRDIMMVNAVCDISGLNTISRDVYRNAAMAAAGMAAHYDPGARREADRPLVLVSTLGTTERTALRIREALEARGFEVMLFHTSGRGGAALDQIVRERPVAAVVDLSLVEIIDHLNGGLCAGPPDRSRAAMEREVPLVMVPGNTDFIVGGPLEEAQRRYPNRRYHVHNPALTAVRTGPEEYRALADHLAKLMEGARGSIRVHVPLGGLSAHDSTEGHLYDPSLPPVLAAELRRALPASVPIVEHPLHVNDPAFADLIVAQVLELQGRTARA